MKIYPYGPLYHIRILKSNKDRLATQMSLRVLKLLRVFIDKVLSRCHNDRVLFRFLSDRVLLRVLSSKVLFNSSMIGSSSNSSVMDSFLGLSVLFFRHAAIIFIKTCYYFLLLKADVLFYIIFSKRTSHLTISSEKNEEILA